jgi:hypothetical protein
MASAAIRRCEPRDCELLKFDHRSFDSQVGDALQHRLARRILLSDIPEGSALAHNRRTAQRSADFREE